MNFDSSLCIPGGSPCRDVASGGGDHIAVRLLDLLLELRGDRQ